jgi:hypothetical protein
LQEYDLVFCREDGTPLDRWHARKEFQKITKPPGSAGPGRSESYGTHSCPSSAHTMSGSKTSATWSGPAARRSPRTVYRHEIRPALTKEATAMNRILKAKVTQPA